MKAFGEFYGHDGTYTFNVTVSDERIQELIEAHAEDEVKFATLATDFEHEDNITIGEYAVRESIVSLIKEEEYMVLPLSISADEYVFGCAMSEEDARIAFSKADQCTHN